MAKRFIYADYAAATPTDRKVLEAMERYQVDTFGNPSSRHRFGRAAARVLKQARTVIASFLNAQAEEIYFTSSGTESNNLALLGVAKACRHEGNHLITSAVEHPSVLNPCRALEKEGWRVSYLSVDRQGLVRPEELTQSLTDRTALVSLHLANSEIGVIQPIKELTRITKRRQILFHTDACQAAAWLKLDVNELGVDLLTFNGSKIYGPKGVAALYVRAGTAIFPIIYGGGQQRSLRSGTENVPGIAGLAQAAALVEERRSANYQQTMVLRDHLQLKLAATAGITVNVAASPRLPNYLSLTFASQTARDLVDALDKRGIAVSSGSACSSRTLTESYVLTAIGLTPAQANSTIRVTLGRGTTPQECHRLYLALRQLAQKNKSENKSE